MIIQIKVRDDNGQYRSAWAGEFAEGAIHIVIDKWGWDCLIMWLAKVCIQLAEKHSDRPALADLWLERYRAIRGIK